MKHRENKPRRRDDDRSFGRNQRPESKPDRSRDAGKPFAKKTGSEAGSRRFAKPGSPQAKREPGLRPDERAGEKEIRPEVQLPTKVQTVTVSPDESNMRVDRFLEARFPGCRSPTSSVVRKGELRVNGKRVDSKDRLEAARACAFRR